MALLGSQGSSPGENTNIRRMGPRQPAPDAPNGPIKGDLWYDTGALALKAWNGTAWVGVASGSSPVSDAGLELYQASSTPYIDFHRAVNPAGDGYADFDMRLINAGNEQLRLYSSAGVQWGSLWVASAKIGSYGWDSAWATFGHHDRMDINSTSYQFMAHSNGTILINVTNGQEMEMRRDGGYHNGFWLGQGGNSDLCVANVILNNRVNAVRDDLLSLWTNNDYMIGIRSETLFFNCFNYISADDRIGGATRMYDWRGDNWGLYMFGWLRPTGGYGLYFDTYGIGLRGDGGSNAIVTHNTETRLRPYKFSQAGYASAGVENVGAVPQYGFHHEGERANSLRKDDGGWNGVWTNQDGNCVSFFASAFGTCSQEARKHNISVVTEYGLKTIQGLVPKRFQYQPVLEDQIWATMKRREEQAAGKWNYMVGPDLQPEDGSWDHWHMGFMAEEIYARCPEATLPDAFGAPYAIDYGKLVIVAIQAINELAERVEILEREKEHLQEEVNEVKYARVA